MWIVRVALQRPYTFMMLAVKGILPEEIANRIVLFSERVAQTTVNAGVFHAGRHRAQSAQAHAVFDEQVADYRNVVLTAYQEVEDNLAALRQLQAESVSEAAAVDATAQSEYRYKAGLVTYLEVATNENANLQAQLSSVNIQVRRLHAGVLLVKALGGGWQSPLVPMNPMVK